MMLCNDSHLLADCASNVSNYSITELIALQQAALHFNVNDVHLKVNEGLKTYLNHHDMLGS
jgi:hypothetical protein